MASFINLGAALVWLMFLTISVPSVNAEVNCLKSVDPSSYPSCKIIDHGGSTECLDKWENSVFLHKDGNVTIDCQAPFPIDMDHEGFKPIKTLHLEFYKELGQQGDSMKFGVKVHIVTRNEFSGDYIFYPMDRPENKVTIYVFAENRDLPQFLSLSVSQAYVDPAEPDAIVIPCRSTNYNATVLGIFYDYEEMKGQFDGITLRYDPRKGFIRKIPDEDSDTEIYGQYECYTEWKTSGRDRKKVYAKAPPSDYDQSEEGTTSATTSTEAPQPRTHLHGIISFEQIPDSGKIQAVCTMPSDLVKTQSHSKLFFANTHLSNPTVARLNVLCSHLDSHCADDVKILGQPKNSSSNVYEIPAIQNAGLVQCGAKLSTEVLEYFTGTDDQIYFDWKLALANDALVKVRPAEAYERYTVHRSFAFHCNFLEYLAASPVRWAVEYENGTKIESFESSSIKTFFLELDAKSIHCGITLWNSSIWHNSSLGINVEDFVLPVFTPTASEDRRKSFKSHQFNQLLRCDIEPTPDVKLEWLRHGTKVEDIPTINLGDSLVLYFQEINSSHAGNYTCRASSKSTSVELEYQIVLDEEPEKNTLSDDDLEGNESSLLGNGTCTVLRSITLHHTENRSEVSSLDNVDPKEVLLLKISEGSNCSNETTDREESNVTELLVTLYAPTNNSAQVTFDMESNGDRSKLADDVEDMDNNTTVGDTSGTDVTEKVVNSTSAKFDGKRAYKKQFYQHLLPLVVGLTFTLLILILAFVTYSYFISPWQIRRISTISSGPLI